MGFTGEHRRVLHISFHRMCRECFIVIPINFRCEAMWLTHEQIASNGDDVPILDTSGLRNVRGFVDRYKYSSLLGNSVSLNGPIKEIPVNSNILRSATRFCWIKANYSSHTHSHGKWPAYVCVCVCAVDEPKNLTSHSVFHSFVFILSEQIRAHKNKLYYSLLHVLAASTSIKYNRMYSTTWRSDRLFISKNKWAASVH